MTNIVNEMMLVGRQSVEQIREDIANVRYGRIDLSANVQYIEFDLYGKHYDLPMLDRNADYILGFGDVADKAIATRVLLDSRV